MKITDSQTGVVHRIQYPVCKNKQVFFTKAEIDGKIFDVKPHRASILNSELGWCVVTEFYGIWYDTGHAAHYELPKVPDGVRIYAPPQG